MPERDLDRTIDIVLGACAVSVLGGVAFASWKGRVSGSASATFNGLAPAKDCEIVYVGGEEGDYETLERLDLDVVEARDYGQNVFDDVGIRTSSIEDVVFVAVCNKEVVGAATVGYERDHDQNALMYTFSVAVAADWQQRSLGRRLVEAVLAHVKSEAQDAVDAEGADGYYYRVWVVNPNMAKLLESFNFETEGRREWSPDSPHMYRY